MRRRASLAVVTIVVAGTVLSGCAAPSMPRSSGIPESLQNLAYSRCVNRLDPTHTTGFSVAIGGEGGRSTWVDVGPLTAADKTGNFFTTWHVHVTPGRILVHLDEDGAPIPVGEELARAQSVGTTLVGCLAEHRFQPVSEFPSSRAALLQLYRYDIGVLWPCLSAHGVAVGAAPSRAAFLTQADAFAAFPVPSSASNRNIERLLSAAEACPAVPPYLMNR